MYYKCIVVRKKYYPVNIFHSNLSRLLDAVLGAGLGWAMLDKLDRMDLT